MKLAIMQPYFLPYIGYWQLINAVDKFVVYDDVTFIKGGWINRNNILADGKKQLFTIKLDGSSSFKLINQIGILDDFIKLQKTISMNYSKAPYFQDVWRVLNSIFAFDKSNLADFIFNSTVIINKYLGIGTELLRSSDLEKDECLKSQERVIDICVRLKANKYYNSIGGKELYDAHEFNKHGIELRFLRTTHKPYAQFKNECVMGLSILDMMMFCSPKEIKVMLDKYDLE